MAMPISLQQDAYPSSIPSNELYAGRIEGCDDPFGVYDRHGDGSIVELRPADGRNAQARHFRKPGSADAKQGPSRTDLCAGQHLWPKVSHCADCHLNDLFLILSYFFTHIRFSHGLRLFQTIPMQAFANRKSGSGARRLTDALIRRSIAEAIEVPAQSRLSDIVVPGLELDLSDATQSWTLRTANLDGTEITISIGSWPDTSVVTARETANRIRRQFRSAVEPASTALTVRSLIEVYNTRKLRHLRRGKGAQRAITESLSGLLDLEASAVTRIEIRDAIDEIADRAPIQANRALAYVKAMYGWALGRGYVEVNPAASLSKPSRESSRDRAPGLEELARIWRAAETLGYPFGDAIRVLMLTATRREEVSAMRVDELTLQPNGNVVWTLPAARSKNGRAIRSEFPPTVGKILKRAIASRPAGSHLVFSTNGSTPISGWSKAKARIDGLIAADDVEFPDAMPLAPWRFHDFRRSFATIASDELGIDRAVADRCLNHVGASTTSTISRVYARSELFDQRREALRAWSDAVLTAVSMANAQSDCPDARNPK